MRRLLLTSVAALLLSACGSSGFESHKGYTVDTRHSAYGARPRVKVLVIHYTAEDFPTSLATLTSREVSVHYLIPAAPEQKQHQPVVLRLVPESELAWHAGPSFWRGASRLNDTSVGIELENQGYRNAPGGRSWSPFPPPQMAALMPLARDIVQRYHILPQDVVGHSDIAPQRKLDPGPLFPWQWLAKQGIGAWPDASRVSFYLAGRAPQQPVEQGRLLTLLSLYGYQASPEMPQEEQQKVIAAFQMHFRPSDYRGLPDAESESIVRALLEKYGEG
ncbi:N-acetylmuramoyl-L-alanine amidase amid [Erwinia typographi]|uniref:N-acetylmuramoyl-L-alanine amidase n=1 Tax=Erwinia typographi TaxID=371042 RepID=A0A0A3Z8Q4_9GAMM|nr:N-acetylmuramoyl-L-alanine amidase [Erwinia typographi]KGT94154.1 N-acetylmuramoyl-L-alanine amidase amid [Erwinia typographi]